MGFSFVVVCTNKRDEALVKSGSACVCVREHGLYGTGILFKECIERVSVISCWHDHTPGQGNPRVDHDALALPSLNSACVILTEVETLPESPGKNTSILGSILVVYFFSSASGEWQPGSMQALILMRAVGLMGWFQVGKRIA